MIYVIQLIGNSREMKLIADSLWLDNKNNNSVEGTMYAICSL